MNLFFVAYDKDTGDYWLRQGEELVRTTNIREASVYTDREEFAVLAASHGYDRKRIKARLILYKVDGPSRPTIKYPTSTVAIKLKPTF